MGTGGCRNKRGEFLKAKRLLRGSSYHVRLAFGGQSRELDVGAASLDGFICGQETSSVDQAGTEQTEGRSKLSFNLNIS